MIKRAARIIERIIQASASREQEQHTQVQQIQLANQYRLMAKMLTAEEMPSLSDVGFKVHSQFEEDGLLLFIFALIGTTNKRVVEICAGDGRECMSANLILHHGWDGLLFDGDPRLVARGRAFYANRQSTWLHPPSFQQAWITRENVNALIAENGFAGDVDLLSVDLDGNDYHVMEAITVITPRVIICETLNVIPAELALTVPYDAAHDRSKALHPDFFGASLLAMKRLLKRKGYRLIGANRYGFNAVFMHDGVGTDRFPEASVESLLDNSYTRFRNASAWDQVKDLPWVTVPD